MFKIGSRVVHPIYGQGVIVGELHRDFDEWIVLFDNDFWPAIKGERAGCFIDEEISCLQPKSE